MKTKDKNKKIVEPKTEQVQADTVDETEEIVITMDELIKENNLLADTVNGLMDKLQESEAKIKELEAKLFGKYTVTLKGHWLNHKPNSVIVVDRETYESLLQAGIIY